MIKSYINILNKLSGRKQKRIIRNRRKVGGNSKLYRIYEGVLIDFELKAFLLMKWDAETSSAWQKSHGLCNDSL